MDQLFVSLTGKVQEILASILPDFLDFLAPIALPLLGILLFAPFVMMYLTWLERKLVARIQNRIGPNRVGPFGLLQPIADGIKMLTKEDVIPEGADRFMHFLAPAVIVAPAMLTWAVLPFGRNMIAADIAVGVLYFIAISGLAEIAIFIAGWGSNNKFSLLGAMRSIAQMLSYEIPMVLSVAVVVMMVGSLSTSAIVEAQSGWGGFNWFIFRPWGLVGFVIFFLAGAAETNRTPFDLAEAESEIVAGFHTEYSGMKFALFFMAEFISVFSICALASTLFLGGWQGPFLPSWAWFFLKTYTLIGVLMWFRGTFPRLRVDQLLGFAWKGLLPMAFVNILSMGLWEFVPRPWNYVVSTSLLVIAFFLIVYGNSSDLAKKRTYVLAD